MSGEVRLRIECLMPEKLLQRATERGIRVSAAVREGGRTRVVESAARDAQRLLELCERFSLPARVLSRRGGSALSQWLWRRRTLPAGLLVMALLCALLLGRIWRVDVRLVGPEAPPGLEATLTQALRAQGIRPGIPRGIDAEALSDALSARLEGFSFIGVREEGVRLRVEASPEVRPPRVYDAGAARDLCAACAGIVVSVNVEAGEACVAPGDAVRPGQTLIRGEERASAEDTRGIAAMGEVIVRTWFEGSAEGSLTATRTQPTGRTSVSARLRTPWLEIPLSEGASFEQAAVTREVIPIVGLYAPVCVLRETRREMRTVAERADGAALRNRLGALALADAAARLAGTGPEEYAVARRWVRYSRPSGDRLRASAVYEIQTNAAISREEYPKGG